VGGPVDNVVLVVHTDAVAEPRNFPRRVFIEDLRRDGMFLRVTWHSEHSAFVVSHWQGEVCVAATRVAATDVGEVVALLTNGLADALASAQEKPTVPPSGLRQSPRTLWQRAVRRLKRLKGDGSDADVIAFPERSAVIPDDQPRWKSQDG
jgi:hypothetical protein